MSDEGWERLMTKLSKLPPDIQNVALYRGVGQAAKKVQAVAKRKAPANDGALRQQIKTRTRIKPNSVQAKVYNNLDHAVFVELGTGPEGAENHAGISPNVNPNYRTDPWWIPGSKIAPGVAEKYNFPSRNLPNGEAIYWTDGQRAQPYLYPALIEVQPQIRPIISKAVMKTIERYCR